MLNDATSLISAVIGSSSNSDLCDAYIAARRPCRQAGMMDDLLAAYDAAQSRIGSDPIKPLIIIG